MALFEKNVGYEERADFLYNIMMDGYGRIGEAEKARGIFDIAVEKTSRTASSTEKWATFIMGSGGLKKQKNSLKMHQKKFCR